uniref:Uncharacterized protein n=1 Tax=Eptatretus burgeri TaxID=7764 RepID=A0A8C4QW81_EPTBU
MDASEQDRMREMEAEMALFEQEVLGGPSPPATATPIIRPVIATNTYQQVQQTLQARAASIPPPCPPPPHPVIGPFIPYRAPPAPPPRPAFVPHVLQRQGPGSRMVPPRPSPPGPPPPPAPPQHVMLPPAHFPPPQVLPMLPISHNSTPKMNPSIIQAPPTVYFAHTLRTQEEVTTAGHTAAHSAGLGDDNLVPVTTAPEESSTVIGPQLPERGGETDGGEGALGTGKKGKVKTAKGNKKGGEKKGKKGSDKPKKSLRTASGITWEDQSLLEWDASGL